MLLVFFRFILLTAPVAALILWLRWRSKQDGDPETLADDMRILRRRLIILLVLAAFAAMGIYLTDNRKAPAGQVYIPPHMEDGVLVPGRFVTQEEAEAFEKQQGMVDLARDREGEDGENDDPDDQTP